MYLNSFNEIFPFVLIKIYLKNKSITKNSNTICEKPSFDMSVRVFQEALKTLQTIAIALVLPPSGKNSVYITEATIHFRQSPETP